MVGCGYLLGRRCYRAILRRPSTEMPSSQEVFGFLPTEYGGMKGRLEDIEISAIEHPLMGVSVTASHMDSRSATQFENFMPKKVSIEDVGKSRSHHRADPPRDGPETSAASPSGTPKNTPVQGRSVSSSPRLIPRAFLGR